MKYRHGVMVLAALLVTAGCGVPSATSQTSMLRGPTPSPGLSIPPLLQITGTAGSNDPSGTGDPGAPDASVPAAGDTVQPAPAESIPPGTGEPTTDPALPTDDFGTDQPDQTDVTTTPADPGATGPDLSQIAASAGCTDYAELDPPDPGASVSGACTVDDQQVLLYGFASEPMAAAFADSLSGSGWTADQLAQGPGYLFLSDVGPITKIKAALGAG